MQHKRGNMQMIWFKKKIICFPNVYYWEIRKNSMSSCAPSHGKWNKIIKFVLSVKFEEIGFLLHPQKVYIFYAIRFLYVSQKKSRSKLCLEPHGTYLLFRTFLSHVDVKWFFFHHPIPLKEILIKLNFTSILVGILHLGWVTLATISLRCRFLFDRVWPRRWKINSFLSEISVCWSCTEKITIKIERAFSTILLASPATHRSFQLSPQLPTVTAANLGFNAQLATANARLRLASLSIRCLYVDINVY